MIINNAKHRMRIRKPNGSIEWETRIFAVSRETTIRRPASKKFRKRGFLRILRFILWKDIHGSMKKRIKDKTKYLPPRTPKNTEILSLAKIATGAACRYSFSWRTLRAWREIPSIKGRNILNTNIYHNNKFTQLRHVNHIDKVNFFNSKINKRL